MFFLRHREFLSDVCRIRDDVHVNSKSPGSEQGKGERQGQEQAGVPGAFWLMGELMCDIAVDERSLVALNS